MKNGIVIADSGPIISLALIDKLWILDELFDVVKIPNAVWEEITLDKSQLFYPIIESYFEKKVDQISGLNKLSFIMDYGESEAVMLYQQTNANFLLIDDKKARKIAENIGINCIGTIGILAISKDKNLIGELKPVFQKLIYHNRYYSLPLLNKVLHSKGEGDL
jgi:predicted nucleic acid-binding protein